MIFLAIDLQPSFSAAKRVINPAKEEAKRARQYQYGAIILEYAGAGRTHRPILEPLRGYNKLAFAQKSDQDGGREVLATINKEGYNADIIRVCGVNTDQCVFDTVHSLTKLSPNSDILLRKDGCDTVTYSGNDFSIFKKLKKVHLV